MADKHKIQIALAPLLFIISYPYRWLMSVRQRLYTYKIMPSYRSKLPTICVGNISWGGTGKSPIVSYLVSFFKKNNQIPLILTRGYGKKFADYPVLLNQETIKIYSEEIKKNYPDEALMLLKQHDDLDILIDPQRGRAAKAYDNKHFNLTQKDCLILDDGFSHFGIARDYDLVLLDKADLVPNSLANVFKSNWNKNIPFGTWRESHKALHRATAFLLKCPKSEWAELTSSIEKKLKIYKKPLFVFEMTNFKVYNIFDGKEWACQKHEPYALVCAVGNPKQVRQSLEEYLEYQATATYFLGDHHSFANDDSWLEKILEEMPIICTEKDEVKLVHFEKFRHTTHSIYVLKTSALFYSSMFYKATQKNTSINPNVYNSDFDNWLTEKIKVGHHEEK